MNKFSKRALAFCVAVVMAAVAVPVCVFAGQDDAEEVEYVFAYEDMTGVVYMPLGLDWEVICELPTGEPYTDCIEIVTKPMPGVTDIGKGFTDVIYEDSDSGVTIPREFVFYRLGDVNADGKIQSADARLALRASARLTELTELQKTLADMNGDGKVLAGDARAILRIAAKLDPVPEKGVEVPAE